MIEPLSADCEQEGAVVVVAIFLCTVVVTVGLIEVVETLDDAVVAVSIDSELEGDTEVAPPHAASNAHAKTKALRRMRSE